MRIMGIDPGLSGGMALIDTSTGELVIDDMPVVEVSRKRVRSKKTGKMRDKVKRSVCGKMVGDWIETHEPDIAYIELVGSRPGEGVVSVFNFGAAYGKVSGAVEAMRVPVVEVHPAVWKRRQGLLGTDKKASIRLAVRKYKRAAARLQRVKDNGRAEALLIADYGTQGVGKRTH